MKRAICLLIVCLLLCGCAPQTAQREQKIYEATFLELFDTVTVIKGAAESKEAFTTVVYEIRDELQRYHQLFDIYHDYDGINNLKTVNDMAGVSAVEVDQKIIDLLLDCKRYYELTGGKVNESI